MTRIIAETGKDPKKTSDFSRSYRARLMRPNSAVRRWSLRFLILIQISAALFFATEILASILQFPLPSVDWEIREFLELIAILAIVLGAFFGYRLILLADQQTRLAQDALRAVKEALATSIEAQFRDWGFSASETAVAWLLIKGFSYAEIAALRGTADATVKSQANAIYQKSGLKSRSQLTAWFLESIFDDGETAEAQSGG